jgi:hypothetical protein
MMYNHQDVPAARIPLPIRKAQGPCSPRTIPDVAEEVTVAIAAGAGPPIALKLVSDSPHLIRFFRENWAETAAADADGRIVALARPPEAYGAPPGLTGSRWFSREERTVWIYGSEYYGNVKITVRGLCSVLASPPSIFLHGCMLGVDNCGLVLIGASGAGKTTVTAALGRESGKPVKIVNDDWGALDVRSQTAVFTGEKALHMKYRSVRAMAPTLRLDPEQFASENYQGDPEDPHARLLISRERAFGRDGVADRARIDKVVLLSRSNASRPSFRKLDKRDVQTIAQGSYSAFYRREEPFHNGSLFLTDEALSARYRSDFECLFESLPCFLVENAGDPRAVAELVLRLPD